MVITANPDTPSPRCVTVGGTQHLKVVNASNQFGQTGRTITVSYAAFPPRQVAVDASTTFDQDFGNYLAPHSGITAPTASSRFLTPPSSRRR